jgi:crotonobetainyl-CoA:carnitine CoA-transferase CaiB-like acyl-CoA transferase
MTSELPLSGVRVLDLSRLLPGAVASLSLSDLGAEIIKVELPPNGDHLRAWKPLMPSGMGGLYHSLNRDKRSVVVDYRTSEGRERFMKLLASAQVFIEGFRPGTLTKYGLDHDTLRELHPALVYVSITGYGQSEEFGSLPSHGLNMDAAAGFADVVRTDGDGHAEASIDLKTGLPRSVHQAGVQAAMAIAAGLYRAQRDGAGCYIDVSCWDAAIASDPWAVFATANDVTLDRRPASRATPKLAPYVTSDDEVIVLCPIEPHLWERFCRVVERPDFLPDYSVGEWDPGERDLYPEVAKIIASRPMDVWLALFAEAGVPASPAYSLDRAIRSPLARDRDILRTDGSASGALAYAAPAVKIDGARGRLGPAVQAPEMGADTEELLPR